MQGLAFTQHYANSKVAKAWIDKGRDKKKKVTDLTPRNSKALDSHANSKYKPKTPMQGNIKLTANSRSYTKTW